MPLGMDWRRRLAVVVGGVVLAATDSGAQTDYYHLEAGHPLRIDDAEAGARRSWALELPTVRVDRYESGELRFREDVMLSAGILPFTEVEARAPLVQRLRQGRAVWALAGIALGVNRQVRVESIDLPALALGGEVLVPLGGLAPPAAPWTVRASATRTLSRSRVHTQVSFGSFSWRVPPAPCTPGVNGCPLEPPPPEPPPDVPCLCGTALKLANESSLAEPGTVARGYHVLIGAGLDRTFPFKSLLIGGDVFMERFSRLYTATDVTAEGGFRWQLSPRIVLDGGVSWHFMGTVKSVGAVLGASYVFAIGPT